MPPSVVGAIVEADSAGALVDAVSLDAQPAKNNAVASRVIICVSFMILF